MIVPRAGLALLLACHPAPTAAVTVVAALLAAAVGHPAGSAATVTAAVLTGQLSIGWSNDWLDRDRDNRSARADKPIALGQLSQRTVLIATGASVAACVVLSLATGALPAALHLLAVASAWAYNLGLKATAASVLPYAVSFGLLPAFVVAAAPGAGTAPLWMVGAGALLGAGAHFANVLPDLDADLATGVRGLGHRLGRPGCALAAAGLLLAAIVVLVLGPPGPPGPAGWAALVIAVPAGATGLAAGRRPGSRAAFTAVLVIAVIAVALLLGSGTQLR